MYSHSHPLGCQESSLQLHPHFWVCKVQMQSGWPGVHALFDRSPITIQKLQKPSEGVREREESGFHAEKKKKAKYRLDSNRARFRQWSGLWSCRGRGRTEMFCHLSTPPLVCAHRPPHYFWQELYSKLTSSLDTVCLQSIRPWKTAN